MAKTFRAWEVDQVWMLPATVRELVPEGHVAHFVRDTVRQDLDLSSIFAETVEPVIGNLKSRGLRQFLLRGTDPLGKPGRSNAF